MAFLGMECAGAPLTWLYQGLFTKPVTKKMSDSRTLSGSNAAQAAAIMTELGASEAYVYAMGEESWLGHVMATTYNEDSYQLKQVDRIHDLVRRPRHQIRSPARPARMALVTSRMNAQSTQ